MEKSKLTLPKKLNVKLDKKLIAAVIGAAFSLLIVILGLIVFCNAAGLSESLYIGTTYASSYSFGADFYTEMFKITYKAVDQLNNLATGLSNGFDRVLTSLRAIAKGVGVLIMSLGFFSMSRTVPALLDLLPEKGTVKAEAAEASVEAETETAAEETAEEEPAGAEEKEEAGHETL